MNEDELKQSLETLREELTRDDFLTAVLDWLAKRPSKSERIILERWLYICGADDPDRVAGYWEPFLYDKDQFRQEVAVLRLAILARLKPDGLAYRLLTEFLGQEPLQDKMGDIIEERFLKIFPSRKGSR